MRFTLFLCITAVLICIAHSQDCPSGTVAQPAPGTSFYWDLTPTPSVANIQSSVAQVFDFDMFYITHDMVQLIHSLNRTLMCYIDTAYEPFRNDSYKFTKAVLGKEMEGWPGQHWVDIQSPVVRQIMADRLQMAVELGCDGIEWDDVDAYSNDNGLHLGPNDQLNFNLYLSKITHDAGLSVGLKNDLDQIETLSPYFDWALNEQCLQFKECDTLSPFTSQNKAVFGAEYKGAASDICPQLNSMQLSFIRTDDNVNGKNDILCCEYSSPKCPVIPLSCSPVPTNYPVFPDDSSSSSLSSSLFVSFFVSFFVSVAFLAL